MNPFEMFATIGALSFLMLSVVAALPLARTWLEQRHARSMKELEIRELEARARLTDAEARAALPEYVDATDPQSVEAYRRARQEVAGRVREGVGRGL